MNEALMEKEKLIPIIKEIIDDITCHFIKEGTPYLIMEGYEVFGELMLLFAKQTNLLESLLLLLENNHTEEANVMFRSQVNNHMIIVYLLDDDEKKSRFKEYNLQPVKNDLKLLYDIKDGIKKGWIEQERYKELDEKIEKKEIVLKEKGCIKNKYNRYNTTPITISKMAWSDFSCFGLYETYYRDGCIYEHSDPSSLDVYRENLIEDVPNKYVFKMNLSKSNTEKENHILDMASHLYCDTFLKLCNKINTDKDLENLLEKEKISQIMLRIIKEFNLNIQFDEKNGD